MVYKRQLFFQYSRPSGCDTSKLLSDDLKNKLYYDGFQKVLYHYSHQKNSTRYRRKFDASWSFLFAVVSDTARYCRKMPDFAVPLSENVVCCRVKMSVLMGDDFCRIVLSAACAMGGGVVC